jgi:2,3,4,5-tetrahydropyridine-2,6-dicarboxylate N-succinyltransferase
VTPASDDVRAVVEQALALLDAGQARVAEKVDGEWRVNQWLKKAVLLSFRLNDNAVVDGGSAGAPAFDKVPQVCRVGRCRLPRRRFPRGAGRRGARWCPYRQERRADAQLRQHRRLRG